MSKYERLVELVEKKQKSNRGKWHWRCKDGNGRILFSSETFNTKFHCQRQAMKEYLIYLKAKVKAVYKERKAT